MSKSKLNPSSMTLVELGRLLAHVGKQPITQVMVRADVEAGAPLNGDGTMNLVHYVAWLIEERGGGQQSALRQKLNAES